MYIFTFLYNYYQTVLLLKKDKLAPSSNMDQIEKYLQEPPTRLLIQGAGHMPMVTHTQQVNSAIQDFLAQQ